ncbi:hypothetical protein, partial [Dyadobacter sp.]|uniref:hypothetical protein n=1 Tax=Dyadobacter sp. TaxID=1914288 RepID=UPI003F71EA7D
MNTMVKCSHKYAERLSNIFQPDFFRLENVSDKTRLDFLLERNPDVLIFDTIYDQLSELVKIEN